MDLYISKLNRVDRRSRSAVRTPTLNVERLEYTGVLPSRDREYHNLSPSFRIDARTVEGCSALPPTPHNSLKSRHYRGTTEILTGEVSNLRVRLVNGSDTQRRSSSLINIDSTLGDDVCGRKSTRNRHASHAIAMEERIPLLVRRVSARQGGNKDEIRGKVCSRDMSSMSDFINCQRHIKIGQNNPRHYNDRLKRYACAPGNMLHEYTDYLKYGLRVKRNKYFIGSQYGSETVRNLMKELDWTECKDYALCSFLWTTTAAITRSMDRQSKDTRRYLVSLLPYTLFESVTTKSSLLSTMRRYHLYNKIKMTMSEYIPQTYNISIEDDRNKLSRSYKRGTVLIAKPSNRAMGVGIVILRNQDDLHALLNPEKPTPTCRLYVVQRYIDPPLLLFGRKFDLRVFMLVAWCRPLIAFFHRGYCRVACEKYSIDSLNRTVHLTNQAIQKKNPQYAHRKEKTVWTVAELESYVQKNVANIEPNWTTAVLIPRMKQILSTVLAALQPRLPWENKYFQLFGVDFLVAENLQIWLLELNKGPSLDTATETQKTLLPRLITETVAIELELMEKSNRDLPLMPLESRKMYEVLHDGTRNGKYYPVQKSRM